MKIKLLILMLNAGLLNAEWNAVEYEKSNMGQYKHAIKELPKLSLKGNEFVLDIGCRDGKISRHIAKNIICEGKVIALDIDSSMILLAKSNTENSSNITFENADISSHKPEKLYDIVTSFWNLHWYHWYPDYTNALKEIYKLLKPGGKALLCHIVDYENHPFEQIKKDLLSKEEWKQHHIGIFVASIRSPDISEVVSAIRQSGFTMEYMEIKQNSEWLPLDVIKRNLPSMPFFGYIEPNKRSEFCDEVLNEYVKKYPLNSNGELFQWLPVIVLVLKK